MSKKKMIAVVFAILAGITILVALASGGQTPANQSVSIAETTNE